MLPTQKNRAHAVAQANANAAIEDFHPDEQDKALQQQYIEGAIGIEDMLEHYRMLAEAAGKGGAQ